MICRIPAAGGFRFRASSASRMLGTYPIASSTLDERNSSVPGPRSCAMNPSLSSVEMRWGAAAGPRSVVPPTKAAVVFCSAAPDDDSMEVEIKIEGMMCRGCTSRVEDVIKKMDGVRKVSVNLETKLALVEVKAASQMDALQVLPALVQAVKDLGFEAEPHFS